MSKLNSKVNYETLDSNRWKVDVPKASYSYLVNSMNALKSERAGVPTIPLYGKTDASIVQDFYIYAESKGLTYPKWQLEYELARISKFGEQGGKSSWKTLKPEAEMYVLNPQPCKAPMIPETIRKYKTLNLRRAPLRSVLRAQIKADKILAKANGWRHFEWKKDMPEAQDDAIYLINSKNYLNSYAYFFSYIRKQKNRMFVPMPFCVNLMQAQYHDPLLEAIQADIMAKQEKSEFVFMADKIGFQNLWPIMAKLSKDLDPSHIVYVVRDFYHMDTTMGEDQKVKHYCPKVAAAFNLGGQAKLDMINALCFSNRIPIATPDGVITNLVKGEASGATVTNQGETFDNEDFDFELNKGILRKCSDEGIEVWRIDSYGNGDDGHSRYYLKDLTKFDRFKQIVEEVADYVCDLFGHLKNEKWKINLGTYGIYCQYEIYQDKDGLHADYPVSLALNAGMHPMHEIPKKLWDSDYTDWRWAEILAHLFGRRDFSTAIDFVDSGLKHGLFGKTREDFIRIFSKYRKYRALRGSEFLYNVLDPRWELQPHLNPVVIYLAKKRGILLESIATSFKH